MAQSYHRKVRYSIHFLSTRPEQYRARESAVLAEQEFLSSTSEEVCELWSGREIVRVTGKRSETNNMKTFVVAKFVSSHPDNAFSLLTADLAYGPNDLFQEIYSMERPVAQDLASDAPSLTLNVEGVLLDGKSLWLLISFIAIPTQLVILLLPALATYYWKWSRKGIPVAGYAYVCFAAGTISIFIGLLLSGRVIQNSTIDVVFRTRELHQVTEEQRDSQGEETESSEDDDESQIEQILCLQPDCLVGSQHFSPFVILFNHPGAKLFRTSRLDKKRLQYYRYVRFHSVRLHVLHDC